MQLLSFPQCHQQCQKIFNPRVSGRCLEGVCVTLGTVWEVLMPNQLMNSNEHCFNQLVPFLPVASDRQKSARFWGVCGVSGRCLEGFLGCLSDSGYCLGSSNAKSIDWIPMGIVSISWFLFSRWPKIGKKVLDFGVSVGCLDGVWKVSWGVWVTLGTVWEFLMPNQLIEFQWVLFQSAGSFSPSGGGGPFLIQVGPTFRWGW